MKMPIMKSEDFLKLTKKRGVTISDPVDFGPLISDHVDIGPSNITLACDDLQILVNGFQVVCTLTLCLLPSVVWTMLISDHLMSHSPAMTCWFRTTYILSYSLAILYQTTKYEMLESWIIPNNKIWDARIMNYTHFLRFMDLRNKIPVLFQWLAFQVDKIDYFPFKSL